MLMQTIYCNINSLRLIEPVRQGSMFEGSIFLFAAMPCTAVSSGTSSTESNGYSQTAGGGLGSQTDPVRLRESRRERERERERER